MNLSLVYATLTSEAISTTRMNEYWSISTMLYVLHFLTDLAPMFGPQ
jgi:hypothetical protein